VRQTVSRQHRPDKQVDAVTHDHETCSVLSAPLLKRKNALVYGEIGYKLDKRCLIRPDQLHLPRKAFLAVDLSPLPSLLPLSECRKRKGLEDSIGDIDLGDRPIEITTNFRRGQPATQREFRTVSSRLR